MGPYELLKIAGFFFLVFLLIGLGPFGWVLLALYLLMIFKS